MGTTYGSVVVLNAANQISGPSGTESAVDDGGIAGATNDTPPTQNTIQPSGSIYSLKGQILDISFLDSNGALVCNNIAREVLQSGGSLIGSTGGGGGGSGGGDRKASWSEVAEDDNLDIDFSYLASSNLSNSIASNFFGSNAASGTGTDSSSDVNNNTNAASNQNDDNLLSGNSAFMNSFNQATFGQSFDETKAPNKTNKS